MSEKKPSGELVDGCPIVFDDSLVERFSKSGLDTFIMDLTYAALCYVKARDENPEGKVTSKKNMEKSVKAEQLAFARLEEAAFDFAMAKLVHDAIEKAKKNPLIKAVP
jgi:hypothetical protein